MQRFATLLMFCAWLLYGAMPAMAMPAAQPMPAMQDHTEHHGHGQMVGDTSDHHTQPCPHGAKGCMAPFCAACLTLLPDTVIGDAGRFIHGYPAPAIAQTLSSPASAPLTPPPRS